MKKPISINELIRLGGTRLGSLKTHSQERGVALEHVRAALPPRLAQAVVSAGLENGQLTIGAAGASWAARLRYLTDTLRQQVGGSMGVDIPRVRIRVVPPRG